MNRKSKGGERDTTPVGLNVFRKNINLYSPNSIGVQYL